MNVRAKARSIHNGVFFVSLDIAFGFDLSFAKEARAYILNLKEDPFSLSMVKQIVARVDSNQSIKRGIVVMTTNVGQPGTGRIELLEALEKKVDSDLGPKMARFLVQEFDNCTVDEKK